MRFTSAGAVPVYATVRPPSIKTRSQFPTLRSAPALILPSTCSRCPPRLSTSLSSLFTPSNPQPNTYLPTPTYTHPHRETFDTTVPTPPRECMRAAVFIQNPKPPFVSPSRPKAASAGSPLTFALSARWRSASPAASTRRAATAIAHSLAIAAPMSSTTLVGRSVKCRMQTAARSNDRKAPCHEPLSSTRL